MPNCEECGQPYVGAGRFCDKCLLGINEMMDSKTTTSAQTVKPNYSQFNTNTDPYGVQITQNTQNIENRSSKYRKTFEPGKSESIKLPFEKPSKDKNKNHYRTSYYSYNPYNPYQYYSPYNYERKKGDNIATVGIIIGIIGFIFGGFVLGIIAIICGSVAISKNAKTTGGIAIVLGILAFIFNSFFWFFIFLI